MTTLKLYAAVGKIYIQQEQCQRTLQQLEQQKQQLFVEIRQAEEAEKKAAEEAEATKIDTTLITTESIPLEKMDKVIKDSIGSAK